MCYNDFDCVQFLFLQLYVIYADERVKEVVYMDSFEFFDESVVFVVFFNLYFFIKLSKYSIRLKFVRV